MSILADLAASIERFETRTIQQKIVFTMWVIQAAERRSAVSKPRIRRNLRELGIDWTDGSSGGGHFSALKKKGLIASEDKSSGAYWFVTEKGRKPLEANYGTKLRALMAAAPPPPEQPRPEPKPEHKTGMWWL